MTHGQAIKPPPDTRPVAWMEKIMDSYDHNEYCQLLDELGSATDATMRQWYAQADLSSLKGGRDYDARTLAFYNRVAFFNWAKSAKS